MIKRRARSQIGNLTFDLKPLENRGQMISNWGMLYTVGKIFLRVKRYYHLIFKKRFDLKNIYASKVLGQ
jgi:hypothetical protein